MNPGDKVKVKNNHKFHSNKEGIILFFGEEVSSGIVVLQELTNTDSVFAVDINDLELTTK